MMFKNKIHTKNILATGIEISKAKKALIMVHGRGGSAGDIMTISQYLNIGDFALLAPQASGNSWYPYSFVAPISHNEPWLSEALALLQETMTDTIETGITEENIYLLGFSQGACLALEFAARNATKFGGIVAFSGGLIGEKIQRNHYKGNFNNTPVFIGSSNPDPHIPVERVHATTDILKEMHAQVTEKIYPNMGHTITQDEFDLANELVFS